MTHETNAAPPSGDRQMQEGVRRAALWLENGEYATVLRATRTAAFEYDPASGRQLFSPNITEMVAGDYDGRTLSEVMVEDGIIHPDDLEASLRFREQAKAGAAQELTLRLKTPQGVYRWFRLGLYPHERDGRQISVGVLIDVDAEVRQRELLRYRAEFDPISGVPNKSAFFQATQRLLEAAPHTPHYLLRFDIDRFKIVNELYGSSVGDQVLRYIGRALQDLALPGETYARLGNDAFSACLTRSQAEVLRYITALEERMNAFSLDFPFVFSVGVLRIECYEGQPVNILCDRAAIAQRKVKGNYIQRYAFYEDWMGSELSREHYIVGGMRHALEDGQFCMYLQPKYNVKDHRIVGAEALVRWIHPTSGIIPPSEFIPMFERNGFILPLDEYIWEQACLMLRRWMDQGLRVVPISVNVSRMHLHDTRLCDKLLELLRKYRLQPRMLELEITESAYLESPQALYEIMDKLQSMGFIFSMDDFGSGYSSLNSLKDILVNIIKIDLNFLKDARRGQETGRNILKDTVRLIHNMGLPVIVEGVEDESQAEFLQSLGCNLAQGYYFARPMPVDQFEAFLPPAGSPEPEA